MPKFAFGKYAGQDYSEVPEDYLSYLISNSEQQLLYCKAELERRKIKVEDSYMTKIVDSGFNVLKADVSLDQSKLKAAFDGLNKAILAAAQPKGT